MDFRQKIFELRSYTPIPFILLMLVFAQPTPLSLVAGFCVALCGELVRLWGVSVAGTETRTTGRVGGTHLFIDGPFGYVRNPLYVGNLTIYIGVGVMANALAPYLAVVAFGFFLVQYSMIVTKEEEYLRSTFGDEYERYVKEVPRFIPCFSLYSGEHSFHRDSDLSRGLHSERRTLQAFTIIAAVITIIYFVKQS